MLMLVTVTFEGKRDSVCRLLPRRILGVHLLEYRESLESGPYLEGTGITWSQLNVNSPEGEAQAEAHSGPGIQGWRLR